MCWSAESAHMCADSLFDSLRMAKQVTKGRRLRIGLNSICAFMAGLSFVGVNQKSPAYLKSCSGLHALRFRRDL